MATWKELGEVPDSDDEGAWDSQESLPSLPVLELARVDAVNNSSSASGTIDDHDRVSKHQTIWDIPLSSQVSVQEQEAPPGSKSQDSGVSSSIQTLPAHEPRLEPDSTPPSASVSEQSLEAENAVPRGSPADQLWATNEQPASATPPDVSGSAAETGLGFQYVAMPRESELAMTQGGQGGRSLRPRKPIQEHPYLLENVQYNKTWKSHGLRPVRVLAEQEIGRQEKDTQDQDFEEDSQLTNKETAPEESEESQAASHFGFHPEIDDMILSDDREPSPIVDYHSARFIEGTQNSQEEEDEFPDPNDVEKWKPANAHQVRKRRSSPKASPKRKRSKLGRPAQNVDDTSIISDIDAIFDIPASPPRTSPGVLAATPMAIVNRLGTKSLSALTPKPSSSVSSRVHSPAPAYQHSELIDLTALENEDTDNDSDAATSDRLSDTDPDQVRIKAKRIRGVLPASWLRLDQQTSTLKTKPTVRHHSPDLPPPRSPKKGVAQRRLALHRPGGGPTLLLSDDSDSDDSDTTIRPERPALSPVDINSSIIEDDAGSAVEEDLIDHMVSRGKRASTSSSGPPRKRKKGQQSTFNGQPSQKKRQQRITGLLGRTESLSATQTRRLQISKDSIGPERLRKEMGRKRKPTSVQPPRLSILDVVEPNAPAFIRIAARTVSKRRDQGRSSPSRKAIMLGTRQDTVDAVGVLKRWNEGMIRSRNTAFRAQPQPREDRIAEPTDTHVVPPPESPKRPKAQAARKKASARFSQPRRMVKQISMDSFVDTGTKSQPTRSASVNNVRPDPARPRKSSYRPAQLEVAGEIANRHTFDVQKRALDAVFRKSRKPLPTSGDLLLEHSINRQVQVSHQQSAPELPGKTAIPEPQANRKKARVRKQTCPQSVDISAPRYVHANDPLPRDLGSPAVILDLSKNEEPGKLLGLAPYGTHYTQHFEVFPLDRGVFFHESTIIGNGRLKRALDSTSLGDLSGYRGKCMFTIDERTLYWGQWDAQTSSELGIVLDWVMERLNVPSDDSELAAASPVRAADFILVYLQDYVSFGEPESTDLFASRLASVLHAFEQRLKEVLNDSVCMNRATIEVMTHILLIAMQVLRLCRKFNKLSEAFQLEGILKRLGTTTANILLRTKLEEVRDVYNHMQHSSYREKGIRRDEQSLICWVTLIRIFEEAQLPRAGFWEVISSTILVPGIDCTFDAAILERAWQTMFTLLPLGEFDATGVAISGMRHTAPLQGWTIPQRLLRRVFQLYGTNSRQSPSFNDYLRAIVSRCHYLVEQWGWYKCNTILGTIFDFFAAQDLHNLRNEEVYQSPPFLDELLESPSLATTPEDRCFHIYLKLIAMSIKRLKGTGMVKEIKNLVARLQPNHSRQYDKMMAAQEADIAALRNHHDLLCTLFWAAPPDLRPSTQSIEGLVILGNSHREACLINLRAWGRLACFVISSCEDISEYKPLADWQRNISQQVLEQFLSVETEVNQQLLGMSAEACKNITQQHKNAVISRNKKVAAHLLHFSIKSFLEVIRYTQTLGAASFALNSYPLEQILTRLTFSSASSNWDILKIILDVLDYFLSRIVGFASIEPSHTRQSWHEEDAIMLLERKFASPLISAVRDVINIKPQEVNVRQMGDYIACVEQAVALAGRIGACLIHVRLARFRQFFQAGKYNLFPDLTKPTASPARKYVSLFVATVINGGIVDLKDLGVTPLNLYFSEITKPFEYLAFENRLAKSFKRLGEAYLKTVNIDIEIAPSYDSNKNMFNHALLAMRKDLYTMDARQKLDLQSALSKALRSTMEQMKADLKSMVLNSAEHLNYVEFVRSIISLIRSQDFCPVDSFFYQISQEYSPSKQDPRLQTAAILSWGLKLEEGDNKAMSGLFYLLFPSFKIALANGELENEIKILKESIEHVHVFNFMLSTMLPAIIGTLGRVSESWILLDTYVEAINLWLSSACIHRQIDGDVMIDILALHTIVLRTADALQMRTPLEFRKEHIVSLTVLIKMLNLLSPSVTAYLINNPKSPLVHHYTEVIDELTEFTRAADIYLSGLTYHNGEQTTPTLEPTGLFRGLGIPGPRTASEHNEQIDRFSNHIIQDIQNNWASNGTSITIKGPSRVQQKLPATQSGQGTPLPMWGEGRLLTELREQIRIWNHAHDMTKRRQLHEAFFDEILF